MIFGYITGILSIKPLLVIQSILFIVLNALDAHSTWLVLKPNNYHRERNPIARWVFRRLKIPGAIIIFKTFMMSWLGVFIAYWWKETLTLNTALLIGNILFVIVVIHNYKVSRHYRIQKEQFEKLHGVRLI